MSDKTFSPSVDDGEIIGMFFVRDERAIEECEKKYGRLFRLIAKNLTGSEEDASECVNDAYFRLWSSIPPERPKSLRAYGARIVRNLSLNRRDYNNAARRSGEIVEELDESVPDFASDAVADSEEISAAINSFLRSVDRESRVAFVLRYWYCSSVETIAERIGQSVPSVKSRLFRTRKKLKSYLEKEGISL